MIVYFANRQLDIIGQASTGLPNGLTVTYDRKTEDVETGVSVFECKIPFNLENRLMVEGRTEVGNYILRSHDRENEFYQIIDVEIDTKRQEVYIYAEDDGMDLLNEVVGAYEADKAYPIKHYIDKYASTAGFVIGINEVPNLARKLSWDGESTASERIASVATQFDGCEVSYSFEIDGLAIVKKYINIYKKRGKDIGDALRLNKEVDRIITKKSIANLATALQCTGGTPEDTNYDDDVEPEAITLEGYAYDDGDFYTDGKLVKSRKALEKWRRLLYSGVSGGHIVKQFSYDTVSREELCSRAIAELKKICDVEINFEVDISELDAKVGDRINIVDDAGELYLSTRILQLETCVVDNEKRATLGEHLMKGSGISQKVTDLAAQFARQTVSVSRATAIAKAAKERANEAQAQANTALESSEAAQKATEAAQNAANSASQSASTAAERAAEAQEMANKAEESVKAMEETISNADAAVKQAKEAASTAQTKASEAQQSAENAAAAANQSAERSQKAQQEAEGARTTANSAASAAERAAQTAESASNTAAAAKRDAENAQKDINSLGESLTTLKNTMSAEYARKTDLTESEAKLQTQISQNAAGISSVASKFQTIDETANNAAQLAAQAQEQAKEAQEEADIATAQAEAAQRAADEATEAAQRSQVEADTAKVAADTAQSVANEAEAALSAAQADLETIIARGDATAAEIAAAEQAVADAQAAAETAISEAEAAVATAEAAQAVANEAVASAEAAQAVADQAWEDAETAQMVADEANGAAVAADVAMSAAVVAGIAQSTADTARANADTAQAQADEAAQTAQEAIATAEAAAAQMERAEATLAEAEQRLSDVLANADATAEEVEAAQADVEAAQRSAAEATAYAEAAQNEADKARADAETAQLVAAEATAAAETAQKAAETAAQAAAQAKADVDKLSIRVTNAETKITQNAEQIALRATKEEVTETLGGYSTKEETESAITVESDAIRASVNAKYEELNRSVSAELEIMADEIGMNFSSTQQQISDMGGDMQSKFAELHKYISFSEHGITIGSSENKITLTLDNSGIIFSKNGVAFGRWDGNDFYTGNIIVEVNERAQFGNFAFVPRSDGSLSFLKVGG
jgi:phage minor structural protein